MDYRAYLASPLWQRIKARVLKRDKHRCRSCGRKAWQVHHGQYGQAVMEGRDDSWLFSLCGSCHLCTTFDVNGNKRPPHEVREWAEALRARPAKTPKAKPKKARRHKKGHPIGRDGACKIPRCVLFGVVPSGSPL